MRKHQHEKMNTERKLTDEQRREKIETKKVEEEKKGIYGAVFKYVRHVYVCVHATNGRRAGSRRCRTRRTASKYARTRSR